MHVIRSDADLSDIHDSELSKLICQRISEAQTYVDHFSELAFYIVIGDGDQLAEADSLLGFSLLENRFSGVVFGSPSFTPSWDVFEEHERWYELVFVLSDDGAGVSVLVAKAAGTNKELLGMCRQFTTKGSSE